MSLALYRKYRSKNLDDIIGQDHIVKILREAIKQGRVAHAYLFTGPRGVGKTSIARIFAHEITGIPYTNNNTDYLDIIEIDAASNNSVEDVRDLKDKVNIAPAKAPKKVYIIDEVHMLSKQAFNALLKTLEEPPEYIVFILATTEVNKLPETIISRTQRFNFLPIGVDDMTTRLKFISKEENININDEAIQLIAQFGKGSFRDSISMLDQLSNLSTDDKPIDTELINHFFGLVPDKIIGQILVAYQAKSPSTIIKILKSLDEKGIKPDIIVQQLIDKIQLGNEITPSLVNLLEKLIDVPRSPYPSTKLLVTLTSDIITNNSLSENNTTNKTTPIKSASLNVCEKKNSTKIIIDSHVNASNKAPIAQQDFSWNKFVDYIKNNYIALFSIISNCGYELKDNQLIIYAINKFNKNKLDDIKYTPLLISSLQSIGCSGLEIKTIARTAPPKDAKIATVAEIMGGGEEIKLNDK